MRMTRLFAVGLAAAFALTSNLALAEGGYGSLSVFDWSVERTGIEKIESTGLRATGGYMFSDIFGIEGHIGTGGTDDIEYPVSGSLEDAEAELNKVLGGFAKLNLPLNVMGVGLNVYGLAGYAYGRVDILSTTKSTTESANSFAWGAGADVALTDRLSLTVDYIDYISRTGFDAQAASLGLRLAFGQ